MILLFQKYPFASSSSIYIMSLVTFLGDENLLEVITEEQTKLLHLGEKEIAFDISLTMFNQECTNYFTMLEKPIYTNLVKDLWKHAYFRNEGCSIASHNFCFPITITPFSIVLANGCENIGLTVEQVKSQHSFIEKLGSFHNTSSRYEPTNPENLLPIPRAWFKFLLTNFYL